MNIQCKGIYIHTLMIFIGFFIIELACVEPCVQLGHRICDCERNSELRQKCKDEVDVRVKVFKEKGHAPEPDNDFCAQLLDTESCNCKAINNYDFEMCLLTRPGKSS